MTRSTRQIKWSEVETGRWRVVCQCGSEGVDEEPADRRVQVDPLDAKTSRDAGECEFASDTDVAVLKIVLKVRTARVGATTGWSAAAAGAPGRSRTTPGASGNEPTRRSRRRAGPRFV